MRRSFFSAAMLLILALSFFAEAAFAKEQRSYDVIIVGAGSGGSAAAIQAARMGMSVVLLEPSDWVGGQMTGAAVSTMDDKTLTRTGIYGEFITKVRRRYAVIGRNVNVCYWGNDTVAFEPDVGRQILLDMFKEAGKVDVIYRAKPVSAQLTENNQVTAAVFEIDGALVTFAGKIFIDATEYGDFIPLTGARYRSGNSLSPNMKQQSIMQDITYTAVVKKYAEGVPPELWVASAPPRYLDYLFYFRSIIRPNGATWPGNYPFDVPTHNAYRALPDPANDLEVLGGENRTWGNITKTVINWANDYPGNGYQDDSDSSQSLGIRFLENPEFRVRVEREAMLKTLCFIYYMQHELGMEDWSVDDGQGYGQWFSNNWRDWEDVRDYASILAHFPPFPYVRESRRLVGVSTMTIDDIRRDNKLKRTLVNNRNTVALGEYPTDIHGKNADEYLEADLGETFNKLPNDWHGDGGLFQIPLGVFIPEKIDGLLAAEKNISVSRVVNGSTRLQPVTMLTGQAAGAIAALSVRKNVQPRALSAFDVQKELFAAKTRLSLYIFDDIAESSQWWQGAETALLYEYMTPRGENLFGAEEVMHWVEVRSVFRDALGISKFPTRDAFEAVDRREFVIWLTELYGNQIGQYKSVTKKLNGGGELTKAELAQCLYEIRVIDARETGKVGKK